MFTKQKRRDWWVSLSSDEQRLYTQYCIERSQNVAFSFPSFESWRIARIHERLDADLLDRVSREP